MRILVVDDDPLVRMGIRAVLGSEQGWEVVGEASDGDEAIERCNLHRPDVVLMDIRMPGTDGLVATRRIVAEMESPPRVLILTTFELDDYVYEALRAGASGFVLKRVPPTELIEAVRMVASGESLVFPAMTRSLIERFAPVSDPRPVIDGLSERESDVLHLLARGLSNREIADQLFVGAETVKTHVGAVLMKLGVRDRTQAVIAAYESGFVRPGTGD